MSVRSVCVALFLCACAPPGASTASPPAADAPAAAAPARGNDATRASKNGEASFKAGSVDVVIHYGRPQAKGRTVWGELVPYGKVWRTGADEATTITFTSDATLGGKPVKAGTYGLFTIPGETEFTLILNQTAAQWGAYEYDASKDVLRVNVTPEAGPSVEAFTIEAEGDTLWLKWAEVKVPVPVAGA
jgi:hypothetical protein